MSESPSTFSRPPAPTREWFIKTLGAFQTFLSTYAIWLILLSGATLRVAALNDLVTYDEAYTYTSFATQSWWGAISDYSLPNNHLLHTLLVKLSTSLLGNHPYTMRLPAFLAGIFVIYLTYQLGKHFYQNETALAAAALVAWLPAMVRYDTDARGYSLVNLFTLLAWLAAARALQTNQLRYWLLLSLALTLGMFTIPTMTLPAGGIYLWTLAEALLRKENRRSFYWGLFGSGALGVLLTILLYTPVLVISGWRKLLANNFVQPVPAAAYFPGILSERLQGTWQMWNLDLPLIVGLILSLGILLSLILHRRIASTRLHLAVPMGVWLAFYILLRRPDAYDRFWAFLLAPLLLWASAGLLCLPHYRKGLTGVALIALLLAVGQTIPTIATRWQKLNNTEMIADYLQEGLRPGDMLLVGYPNNAPLWYYLTARGVDPQYWQARPDFKNAVLVVSLNFEPSPEKLIRSYKLDPALFDLEKIKNWGQIGQIRVYSCPPK